MPKHALESYVDNAISEIGEIEHPDLAAHETLGLAAETELDSKLDKPGTPAVVGDLDSGATLSETIAKVNELLGALRTKVPDVIGTGGGGGGGGGAFDATIVSGLVEWWSADAITGLADGDLIPTWPNSQSAHDITQATSGNQPAYQAAGLDSRPAVLFGSGGPKRLRSSAAVVVSQPITIVIVRNRVPGSSLAILLDTNSGSSTAIFWFNGAGGVNHSNMDLGVQADMGTLDPDWNILMLAFDGASSKFTLGGGSWTTVNAGTGGISTLTVGDGKPGSEGNYWTGSLAQLPIYDHVLSDADANMLGNALVAAYPSLSWTDL